MNPNNNKFNLQKKKENLQIVNTDVFNGLHFFSSSNSLYREQSLTTCKPDVVIKNNKVLFIYESCKDIDFNSLYNIFKNIKIETTVTISDAIYRDQDLGIDDINFSGNYTFLNFDEKRKTITFLLPSTLNYSSRIEKYKNSNFVYTPHLSILNFDTESKLNGIINYYGQSGRSSLQLILEAQEDSYLKFIGTANNDKLFKITKIYQDLENKEIVLLEEDVVEEEIFDTAIIVESYIKVTDENFNRNIDPNFILSQDSAHNPCLSVAFPRYWNKKPEDRPPVLPAIGDLIKCGCECMENCLFPAIQWVESRGEGNPIVAPPGSDPFIPAWTPKDGCGAGPGPDGDRGPYQVTPGGSLACAKRWCPPGPPNWNGYKWSPEQKAFNSYCESNICPNKQPVSLDDIKGQANDTRSCQKAKRIGKAIMKCCWADQITKDKDCDDDNQSFDCLKLAKMHHRPCCKSCGAYPNGCGTGTMNCNFHGTDRQGRNTTSPFAIGSTTRCDCYGRKIKDAICVLARNGYIPQTCASDCFSLDCSEYPGWLQADATDGGTEPDVLASEINNGPYAIEGYYPLYTTPEAAKEASPSPIKKRYKESTEGYTVITLRGVKYYMPNGLEPGVTEFMGDYPYQWL